MLELALISITIISKLALGIIRIHKKVVFQKATMFTKGDLCSYCALDFMRYSTFFSTLIRPFFYLRVL